MRGFVQRLGGVNLWSVGAPSCCGTPGFCPALLTATDPGIVAALNIAAATRQGLAVTGLALPASQAVGGARAILVTAVMPAG